MKCFPFRFFCALAAVEIIVDVQGVKIVYVSRLYGYFTMTSLRQWTTLKSVPRPLRV